MKIILLILLPTLIFSQTEIDSLIIKNDILELIPENENTIEIYEQIENFHLNPIDLQTASFTEISELPFIDNVVIQEIIKAREEEKKLDWNILKRIVKKSKLKIEILKYCSFIGKKNDFKINIRNRIILPNESIAIVKRNIVTSKIYQKFNFNCENILSQITYFKDYNLNTINNNYYGFIKFKNNYHFNEIIVGDYNISSGEGVSISKNYISLNPNEINFNNNAKVISSYSTMKKNNFRGIATSVNINPNIILSPFISFKKINSIVDTSKNVTSLYSLSDKSIKINETAYGFVLSRNNNLNNLEVTYLKSKYSHKINSIPPYNLNADNLYVFGFSGRNIYEIGKLYFDISKSLNTKNAYLIGFETKNKIINYSLNFRNYDIGYINPFSKSYSQQNITNGEKGILFGLTSQISETFKIVVIADDYSIFDENKYLQNGREYSLKFENENRKYNYYLLFKQNDFEEKYKNNYRINLNYQINQNLIISQRLEFVKVENENGFLSFTDFKSIFFENKFKINLRFVNYKTDSFSSRIYAYENDVPGYFIFNSFYNEGNKVYLLIYYDINNYNKLSLKLSYQQKNNNTYLNQKEEKNQINLQYDLAL